MHRAESINPAMLTWARKTAGLSAEEAARKIGLGPSKRNTAAEKLQALEAGEAKPTRKQLEKIAKAYWRPLTTFYLASPPKIGDRGIDFRQPTRSAARKDEARLDALLRNLCARQRMVRSLLEDDDDAHPLPWVGSISPSMPVKEAAAQIRATLEIGNANDFCRRRRTAGQFFSALRRRIEELRVFVLLAGDLGSHHTAISAEAFRGFAIADDLAPFIVINSRNAKVAQAFTLIHELTHIMVGKTGVSAPPATTSPATPEEKIERFCNDVANEFLPSEKLLRQLHSSCSKKRREKKRQLRAAAPQKPMRYATQKTKIGDALLKLVDRMLRANELAHTEAARILGVSAGTVGPLLKNSIEAPCLDDFQFCRERNFRIP